MPLQVNHIERRPSDTTRSRPAAPRARCDVVDLPPGRPRATRCGLVERPALVGRLASSSAPLVVLSAPVGYGKTTLLAQWARHDRRRFAWIALDERAADPSRLVAWIAARLHEVEPLPADVMRSVAAPGFDGGGRAEGLLAALDGGRAPLVLVLDDAQALDSADALAAVWEIANHLGPTSTVAIASRREPLLPIGRLRAQGAVLELGARDLAMSTGEATELFELAGLELEPADVASLRRRTEGWPAALQLAAHVLRDREPDGAVAALADDDRVFADYVRSELLDTLNRHERALLVRSSPLDRLSGALCDAALELHGTGNVLRSLSRGGTPLFPLDRRDHEYRLHGLVAAVLRSELRRAEAHLEPAIRARASLWFERSGDPERAVDEAIAAADVDRAAALLETAAPAIALRGRSGALARWMVALDDRQISAHPVLALAAATSRMGPTDRDLAERWVRVAEDALGHSPQAVSGRLAAASAALRAAIARDGLVQMQRDAARAYALASHDSPWRALACLLQGVALHLTGEAGAARLQLAEGARRGLAGLPPARALCLAQLSLLARDEDAEESVDLADRALAEATRAGLDDLPVCALVFAVAASAAACHGSVEAARASARRARRAASGLADPPPWYEAELRLALADAELRLSDAAAARDLLAKASRAMRRLPEPAAVMQRWIDDAWARADAFAAGAGGASETLTVAELRVLRFLPTHMSFREIGVRLHVSANTVKTQAYAAYRKLDASSRSEAVARARAIGLVDG